MIAVLADTSSMLTIHAFIDDSVTSYQADGLVVSTPTGSTIFISIGGYLVPLYYSYCYCSTQFELRLVVDSKANRLKLNGAQYLVSLDGESQTLTLTPCLR